MILKTNSQSNVQGNIPKNSASIYGIFWVYNNPSLSSINLSIIFKVVHQSVAYFVKRKVSQQIQINDKKHAIKYITIKYYLFATNKKTIQEKTISFSVPFVWMNLTKGSLCVSKN